MDRRLAGGMFLALALTLSGPAVHAQTAGQDMKGAGRDTKDAAVDTGHATKKVAKKTGHGTKVVAKKTGHVAKVAGHDTKVGAEKTVHGTENLGDKIAGKPATH